MEISQENSILHNETQDLNNLPDALIHYGICAFQVQSDKASLAQTNHFFNRFLANDLEDRKNERKRALYEASRLETLFKYITGRDKEAAESQKAARVSQLMNKFITGSYDINHVSGKYPKIVLTHVYDLDKKNADGCQFRLDSPCYFWVTQTPEGQERLEIRNINLSSLEIESLAETFCLYYSHHLKVNCGYNHMGTSYISFDLKHFLDDVLPVILNLAPMPTLFKFSCAIS